VKKYKKLVVYGCSLTKDNYLDTWADLLSKKLGVPLINRAERGAGYNYILQKVLSTEFDADDLCVIMWPSSDRYDLYVNDAVPHLQSDLQFASWLDGKSPSFVDYDGSYNSNKGWLINGAVPRGYKHLYYKYFYNETFHVNNAWATISSVQSILNQQHVKYCMCNSYSLRSLTQYHYDNVNDFNWQLYNKINKNKFVKNASTTGFIELAIANNFKFCNPHYPDTEAHQWFLDEYILPKLMDKNLLK